MARGTIELTNPIFHDDNAARDYLESVLWPHGPVCPRCGVMGDRITKMAGKSLRPGVYNCKDCRKPFSVTVGTVMERSHIPLSKWVLGNARKGGSSLCTPRTGTLSSFLRRVADIASSGGDHLFQNCKRECQERHPRQVNSSSF